MEDWLSGGLAHLSLCTLTDPRSPDDCRSGPLLQTDPMGLKNAENAIVKGKFDTFRENACKRLLEVLRHHFLLAKFYRVWAILSATLSGLGQEEKKLQVPSKVPIPPKDHGRILQC